MRWWKNNNRNRFHSGAPHAALSRLTTANSRDLRRGTTGCIGHIGQSRISRFRRLCVFDICAIINSACRFFGLIRID
ncbi:hypothetical protein BAE36_27760 [Rhizobium leguminosarum bv. trifolii]|nr:hypothetical protein BAE36_27760 [Rhizobium leguminosarum bv. trifolii]